MNIVFILRKLSKNDTLFIREKFASSSSHIFFDPAFLTNGEFSEFKKEIIPILAVENSSDRWIRCFNEVNQFGHSFFQGKKVIDWLSYSGNTLWYYIRPLVFLAYKSRILSIDKILSGIEKLKRNEVANISVFGDSADVKYFIPPSVKITEYPEKGIHNSFSEQLRIFNFIILFFIRSFIGLFQLPFILFHRNCHILFEDPKKTQKIIDLKTMKTVTGDSYVEYLKQQASINKDFILLSELFIPNVRKEPLPLCKEFIFSRYFFRTLYFEIFFAFTFINPLNIIRIFRLSSRLKKFYLSYNENINDPKQRLIFDTIRNKHHLVIICLMREFAAQLFLTISGPATIGGDHEHELKNKPILTVAQRKGIKTFGIQHGLIHPLHFHYMFSPDDLFYHPIPDYTIVWGEHWKNILMKHSVFSEEKLTVLGQVRTDCIPLLKKLLKKDIVPSLISDKPVILFASQPFRDGESHLQREIINDFFSLVNDFPGVEFILKTHPYELDLRIYTSRIKDVNHGNFHLISDDIYKLISIANIVLVYSSTVGTETIYFKKNLVVLDYHKNDIMEYVKQGVAFRATRYQELKEVMTGLLNGKLKTDENVMNRFIENHVYRIDGKTCDRYIDYIRTLDRF